MEKPVFDAELKQTSISVKFWVDYLKEYDVPKINEIVETIDTTLI